MTAEIIKVSITRDEISGWFVATSPDLPGLFIANQNIDELMATIADNIKAIYLQQWDVDVAVMEAITPSLDNDRFGDRAWVTIPSHVASAASIKV